MTERNGRTELPYVVVGAGLTGLCCARRLVASGRPVVVLDAAERVGGRVVTDRVDGFLLDVGFQVLLTSYSEAQAQLDYEALGLRSFRPGSLIRLHDRVTSLIDPHREPLRAPGMLFSPLVSIRDGWRMLGLRRRLLRNEVGSGDAASELAAAGISERLRRSFFDPFFGGVTLDPELGVPADYFAFLFQMFATGSAALPASGMGAIPAQLAAGLPEGSVRLSSRVREAHGDRVVLDDGQDMAAAGVVLATDGSELGELVPDAAPVEWNGTTTLYFGAERPPFEETMLMLNGTGEGPIQHLCVPSQLQPGYAPSGSSLVSVSVPGAGAGEADSDLEPRVRDQLRGWFGTDVDAWRTLRIYRVPRALPRLPEGRAMTRPGFRQLSPGLWVAGDHLATPSIQGAMGAGRQVAEALLGA